MSDDLFETLRESGAGRCYLFHDAPSGLRAALVIDDLTLGPAAGGIRTATYPTLHHAINEAAGLARAMTLKCALAGLDAGGAKAVVLDHDGLDRPRAFAALGRRVEELGGIFRTAGDLGTTQADLEAMATTTGYVHTDEVDLSRSVARGMLRCVEACAEARGREPSELRVAVQGAGAIGSAVARALRQAGIQLVLADLQISRAGELAAELGAEVCPPDEVLAAAVDVVAPCAAGGVLDADAARRMRAWGLCGAANNIVDGDEAAAVLVERGILHVPDVVASAGAVIDGIGRTVMGLDDRAPLIDALGETARRVLRLARERRAPADRIAAELARERIDRARAG
jgi:leucine dehydrogenase